MLSFTSFIAILLYSRVQSQLVFTSLCFAPENLEYLVFDDTKTFNGAQVVCQQNDANLVKIASNAVFGFVRDTAFVDAGIDNDFWFGAQRVNNLDPEDPLTFQFFDGTTFSAGFGGINGEFPWRSGEPSGVTNICGEFDEQDRLFKSNECDRNNRYVCERPCPTEQPTKTPTLSPTKFPSESPIVKPTTQPTKNPTKFPTDSPTESPSQSPTRTGETRSPTASPVGEASVEEVEEVILGFLKGPIQIAIAFGGFILFICLVFVLYCAKVKNNEVEKLDFMQKQIRKV